MLKDDLYSIKNITGGNKFIEAVAKLNAEHEIFTGHFPKQPVLPGVCMMQMVKEIVENFRNQKLQLLKADDIKFSSMIDPAQNAEVKFMLQYGLNEIQQINVNAKILNNKDVVCCKMKATYKII
ncbi:MAG: 3-hydroxyacyl-ACP dehydratase [Parafilimonas sp.]|nr:3-hydroxyacyl-ACP dehydratase [Parafilimonas sp.]